MSAPESLRRLVGEWTGTNRLWLSPEENPRRSDSTATVALAAGGQAVTISYTWSFDGQPQEGILILERDKDGSKMEAVWTDSWHMSDKLMVCEGSLDEKGVASVTGSYAAPPGPDWGWRTSVGPGEGGSFHIRMYNITPEGQEALAVEAIYSRRG